jgi:xylulokinase
VGDFQSNLGSVGNFGIIHTNTNFIFSDIGALMINFPYTVDSEHTYVTVPTTTTGGQCIRYLRDIFSPAERELERATGISAYDLLTMQAEKVPPGSEGLLVLPFLMGERTPIWDVYARGVIFGLTLNHTKGHLVRAMMEAVAYAMYDSFRLITRA